MNLIGSKFARDKNKFKNKHNIWNLVPNYVMHNGLKEIKQIDGR